MRELGEFLVFVIIVIAVLGLLIIPPTLALSNFQCSQFGQQVGYQTVYRIPSGCYVQIDETWVPYDSYWKYVRVEVAK